MTDPMAQRIADRYSSNAHDYDTMWSPIIRPMSAPLFPHLPDPGNGIVVEVGCGTGILSEDVRAVFPHARIVGADFSEGMTAQAKQRLPVFVANAATLPLRSASASTVYAVFMLQHTPDPVGVIAEMGRIVASGGAGATVTWGAADLFAGEVIADALLKEFGIGEEPAGHRTTALLDDEDKVRAAWTAAGFSDIHVWSEHFEVPWTFDSLLPTFQFCFRDRYGAMDESTQERFITELRVRIDALSDADRHWRDAAVFAIARKPG